MNRQEIFDTVAKFLFNQGHPSKNESGLCSYRGNNGDKCAVGCLLSDDLYRPEMDEDLDGKGTGMEYICKHFGNIIPLWFHDNYNLLLKLQDIHDTPSSWGNTDIMKSKFYELAEEMGLSTDVLNNLYFDWDKR